MLVVGANMAARREGAGGSPQAAAPLLPHHRRSPSSPSAGSASFAGVSDASAGSSAGATSQTCSTGAASQTCSAGAASQTCSTGGLVCSPPSAKSGVAIAPTWGAGAAIAGAGVVTGTSAGSSAGRGPISTPSAATAPAPPPAARGHTTIGVAGAGGDGSLPVGSAVRAVAGSPPSHSRSCPRSSTAPESFHVSFAGCTGPLKKGGPAARPPATCAPA